MSNFEIIGKLYLKGGIKIFSNTIMPHHFGTMKLKGKGVINSTEWKTTPSLTRPVTGGGPHGPNQWTPSQDKSHSLQPIGGSLSSEAIRRLEM